MKKIFFALPVVGFLSACGTSSGPSTQSQNDYRLQEKIASQAIAQAPKWMFTLPKEPGVIYENGTAISSDFSMADLKAKTMAYVKICTSAGGKVRSQMKMYRADNDGASVEQSELTARSICPDVDIAGVETVEMKHVAEGNRIRSYVLVALPMGSKNLMKSNKEIENRSGAAFQELDGLISGKPVPTQIPKSEPVNAQADGVSVVKPDGSSTGISLMPVENADYKARRAEALQKPGAVIGQVSISN